MSQEADTLDRAGKAAGRRLAELLEDESRYRRRWQRRALRESPRRVNRLAVERVLMEYLNDTGDAGTLIDDERSLQDLVRRALDGDVLTPRTLNWFVNAFEMGRDHEEELHGLLGESSLVASGLGRVLTGTPIERPEPDPRYRTVSLHEFHFVGMEGLPVKHRTQHVIESLVDGLDRYPYVFDAASSEVNVLRGGRAGPMTLHDRALSLHRVDIFFDQPLDRGETQSFVYETDFRYQEAPPPFFRRAALRRVDNFEIRVEFHPDKIPDQVWWTRWQSLELDAPIVGEVPVTCGPDNSVERYLFSVRSIILGFRWEWA